MAHAKQSAQSDQMDTNNFKSAFLGHAPSLFLDVGGTFFCCKHRVTIIAKIPIDVNSNSSNKENLGCLTLKKLLHDAWIVLSINLFSANRARL